MVISGQGTYLMGNVTSYTSTSSLSKINIVMMTVYLKKQLLNIAQGLLFELNDNSTRQRMITGSIPVLESLKAGNAITDYRIVCDETNNTAGVIAASQLVVDVYINPVYTAETIQINIINSTTSEAFIV